MKFLALTLVASALVLLGAGCAASKIFSSLDPSDSVVEGRWKLAFTLPKDWVMVQEYNAPRKEAVTPSQEISYALQAVILQSTAKAIVESGTPDEAVAADTYVTSDYAFIRVDRLDDRRIIPKDALDEGNGFFSAEGRYYLQTSTGEKYQFTITNNGKDIDDIEKIIFSASVVEAAL